MAEPVKAVKFRPDKLTCIHHRVTFLCHVIKEGFLKPDQEKLKKSSDRGRTTNPKRTAKFYRVCELL